MQHHLFEITCTELPEQSLRNEDSRLQESLLRKVAQPLPMTKLSGAAILSCLEKRLDELIG